MYPKGTKKQRRLLRALEHLDGRLVRLTEEPHVRSPDRTETAPPLSLETVTGGSTSTRTTSPMTRSPSNTTAPSPSRTSTVAPALTAATVVGTGGGSLAARGWP